MTKLRLFFSGVEYFEWDQSKTFVCLVLIKLNIFDP